jgi:hypothetical protein
MIKSRWMRWAGYVSRIGEKRKHIGYWWESEKERDHWEDQDVSGLDLAQDRDQWRALVNTVMDLRVP